MGVVTNCVCSGENLNDQENKDCITIESKFNENHNDLEEFFDIQNKRKIVIVDLIFLEKYVKNQKNFIIPSKNLIKTTEVSLSFDHKIINYYNTIFPCNYLLRNESILLLFDFNSKIKDNISTCRSFNPVKNLDYKIEDLYLISSTSSKTIDLIDINIKANLKRNFELKGSIVNYNEFRCQKLLYRKITQEELSPPIYFICELKDFSKTTLEEILFLHSDKKLISILFDYHDESSNRNIHYLIFIKKSSKKNGYEYSVEAIPPSISFSFLRDFNKCLEKCVDYKLCCLSVDSDTILIVKKKYKIDK